MCTLGLCCLLHSKYVDSGHLSISKNSSGCVYSALYFNEYEKIFESHFANYAVDICQFGHLSRSLYHFWHGFLHYYPIFVLYIEEIMKVRLKNACIG